MTKSTAERIGVAFEDFIAFSAKEIPVQRVGQPEDIAAMASFLVSEGAGFVSGQVIYVAGGPLDLHEDFQRYRRAGGGGRRAARQQRVARDHPGAGQPLRGCDR